MLVPCFYIGQPQPHHVGLGGNNDPTLLINPHHINFDPLWTHVHNTLPHQQTCGILTEESCPCPQVDTEVSCFYTNTLHATLPVTKNPKVYYSALNLLAHLPLTPTSDNNSSHLDPVNHYINPTTLHLGPADAYFSPKDYCPPNLWKS